MDKLRDSGGEVEIPRVAGGTEQTEIGLVAIRRASDIGSVFRPNLVLVVLPVERVAPARTAVAGNRVLQHLVSQSRRAVQMAAFTGDLVKIQEREQQLGVGRGETVLLHKQSPQRRANQIHQYQRRHQRRAKHAFGIIDLPRPQPVAGPPDVIGIITGIADGVEPSDETPAGCLKGLTGDRRGHMGRSGGHIHGKSLTAGHAIDRCAGGSKEARA